MLLLEANWHLTEEDKAVDHVTLCLPVEVLVPLSPPAHMLLLAVCFVTHCCVVPV